MARLSKNALPSLRLHRASGQGVVTLNGRDFYLGPRAEPACEERYNALLARWISNGRRPIEGARDARADDDGITVVELIAKYVEFAEDRYSGRRATVHNVRRALSVLRTLFGREPVADFGPKALRTYQRALVELPPQHFANGTSKREGPLARTGKLRAEGPGFYAPRDEAHGRWSKRTEQEMTHSAFPSRRKSPCNPGPSVYHPCTFSKGLSMTVVA